MSTTKTTIKVTAAVLALVATLTLAGCSNDEPTTTGQVSVPSASASASASVAPASTPVVVADEFSQVVDGVVIQGTAGAPVKIGADIPGQAPAAEATFPVHGGFEAIKPAAIALDAAKYTVIVSKDYAPDDTMAQGPAVGYQWRTFRINEYGNWKASDKSGTLPTKQAAIDAPKTLDGRTLDRSEYVIAYY